MNTLCIVLLVSLTGYVRIVAVNEACEDTTPACEDGHYCEDSKCKIKAGMTCSEGAADQCIKGATCNNTKCECGANHTANADMTMCQLKIHQNCSAAGSMCMMGTTCKEQTCMCPEKSGPNTAMDKCLMYIGEMCVTKADCVEGETDRVVCDADKKCACELMYAANDMMNMCISGSAAVVAPLFLLVAAFVTSRLMFTRDQ